MFRIVKLYKIRMNVQTHQFRMKRTGIGLLHLRGQKVGEAFRRKPVDVVDRVSLARQRVDEHPGAGGDGRLGDLEERARVETSGRNGRNFGAVRTVAGERHPHVHHLIEKNKLYNFTNDDSPILNLTYAGIAS